VNPSFELNQNYSQAARDAAVPALLMHLQDDDPQVARVTAAQQLLFPADPRVICQEIGLNWWAALKLYEDGWLSFSPEKMRQLDGAQEAELRFVGSLIIAGCDRAMLTVLLAGLSKPYAYDPRRLYFDWAVRQWRSLPDPHSHPEAAFTDWLEALVQTGDVGSLSGIGELAHDALLRVRAPAPQQEFDPKHWTATSDSEQVQG
jgi:hypothetical protein